MFCFVLSYAVSSMEFQSSEIKTEADSNDVTESSHDDKPSTGMSGFSVVISTLCVNELCHYKCRIMVHVSVDDS